MPSRENIRRTGQSGVGDPGRTLTDVVVLVVYYSIPVAALGVIGWLAYDAFRVSAVAGARSLCAALLPVLICSYVRWVRSDWLALVDRLPNIGLMIGGAGATIAVLTIIASGPSSRIVPQFTISFSFCVMLLARTDVSERGRSDHLIDEKMLHAFFGVAMALALYGLFALHG
jgi:hypothetical protein